MGKKTDETKEPKLKIRYNTKNKIIGLSTNEKKRELDLLIEANSLDTAFDKNNNTIVLLTADNAKKIEDAIKKDNNYFPFANIIYKYYENLVGCEGIKENKDNSLFAIIREIDRDNSTNVWRYKKNRKSFNEMIEYITDSKNDFWIRLEQGDEKLPDDICKKCGSGLKSLSSKVCKYLCEYANFGDNYYINDSFIRAMLLFYLDAYDVNHEKLNTIHSVSTKSYEELYYWLDQLHQARDKKHDDEIKKSELDHIMWYCYKSFEIS